ncbi:MAG: hypothetical protein II295_03535 [Akkermansia sp.]|jgi:hypothetical protein|nr:hypothetical protein [Akkermansia sp.]
MKFSVNMILGAMAAVMLASCGSYKVSTITEVSDLPLKSTSEPSWNIDNAPRRAHSKYLMYGARTNKERLNRVGDYYYVRWYDASPSKPTKLVMRYTQALTASKEITRTVEIKEPRQSASTQLTKFFFDGAERRRRGDILSWRMELYVDGKLTDTEQSYLWQAPVKK